MQPIIDRTGKGNSKIRILFEINDKDHARNLYNTIGVNKQNILPETDQKMQIYFLLSEEKFEKYADVAAEKYLEEARREEEKKARIQAERETREVHKGEYRQKGGGNNYQNNDRGGNKRGGDRDRRRNLDHQEKETGIKFGS